MRYDSAFVVDRRSKWSRFQIHNSYVMALAYHAKQDGSAQLLTGRLRHLKPVLLFRLTVCICSLVDWYDNSSLSVRSDGFVFMFPVQQLKAFHRCAMEFPDLGEHCSEKTCKRLGMCFLSE